ncbi:Hypothetical predicted protein [Octopus vulgaris]|uniref:Uncharacterized protein n=1 Tax=Octopus vulgaris TaxID=6645 RepID=A0AA36AX47_OCTVU|nr:Hypothetical predicted protein [Octopus vulgaris]
MPIRMDVVFQSHLRKATYSIINGVTKDDRSPNHATQVEIVNYDASSTDISLIAFGTENRVLYGDIFLITASRSGCSICYPD